MNNLPDQPHPNVPADAGPPLPAEAVATRVQDIRVELGFPAHQTQFIQMEAKEELEALQRQNHCSIGLAIHA